MLKSFVKAVKPDIAVIEYCEFWSKVLKSFVKAVKPNIAVIEYCEFLKLIIEVVVELLSSVLVYATVVKKFQYSVCCV